MRAIALPHRSRQALLPATVLAIVGWGMTDAAAQSGQPATSQKGEIQWWKGTCEVPGANLEFVVVFRPADGGQYTATIDIPVQGAKDLPLTDVVLTAGEIRFTIPPPANAVFETQRAPDGKTATGELRQYGGKSPLRLERITEEQAKTAGPARPQTPKPPFPYQQREVTYENPKDRTKLAGTLTIPQGAGPHPAVLLITGSGAQDRDETIFGHKPFFVIADHLTRHGIAVLRVDDRGVGGSTGVRPDVTSADFAGDVEAGVAFLKQQPEIDARRIGLVGHSEGAVIAPLVAAKSRDVACIILLGGSGWPGDKLLILQNEALLRAAGTPDAEIQQHLKAHRAVHQCLRDGASEDKLRAAVRELVQVQWRTATGGKEPDAGQIDQAVELGLAQLGSPWMRWFLRHDPRESLRQVKCPVLALSGSLDLQVPPKENLPEVEKALRAGGNSEVTVKELPGLNHLFQEARTGAVEEYGAIAQTMSPVALDELTGWLQKQFKLGQ
jgi:pimeloyl-ACP methyl ester carboxylesterase